MDTEEKLSGGGRGHGRRSHGEMWGPHKGRGTHQGEDILTGLKKLHREPFHT